MVLVVLVGLMEILLYGEELGVLHLLITQMMLFHMVEKYICL
jgi:hypothetical protein